MNIYLDEVELHWYSEYDHTHLYKSRTQTINESLDWNKLRAQWKKEIA